MNSLLNKLADLMPWFGKAMTITGSLFSFFGILYVLRLIIRPDNTPTSIIELCKRHAEFYRIKPLPSDKTLVRLFGTVWLCGLIVAFVTCLTVLVAGFPLSRE